MLLLRAALALLTAQLLPGLLLACLLGLGRSRLERFVMAATLGGPLSAALYYLPLAVERPELYWVLLVLVDAAALVAFFRRPAPSKPGPPRGSLRALWAILLIVETAYLATTGWLFRVDRSGDLLLDAALQRDTLFHVGVVRALEFSYPPELLSVSGVDADYHAGYHLQVAAWGRFFGIDAFDGVYRVGACWSLALLVGATFSLGLRFHRRPGLAVLSTALVFGSGFGYLFFAAPGAGWWSLVFLDASLVSIFLVNPFLPALSLFFVGLACLDDYLLEGERGALGGACVAAASLLTVKVFLGVQLLAAAVGAALVVRRESGRRLRRATAALTLAALPFLALLVSVASGRQSSVRWRPLEIVRYSMEKLGREEWVRLLADVGAGDGQAGHLAAGLALTALWLAGFLGLRLVALPALARDAISRVGSLRQVGALFVLAGFAPALLLRVAPAEATGLSRLEAINDVLWFSTGSGILMWFWVAEVLGRAETSRGRRPAIVLGSLLAFPATVQHFVYKRALAPDVVPAAAVEAAQAARSLSAPGEAFLEPPDRVRPSLLAYLAGRPVVYDSYVDYDYMFVSRRETDFRRHALAQFWRSDDAGYACWFLRHYEVRWVYATPDFSLPEVARNWAEVRFANAAATLYRLTADALPRDHPVGPAGRIPMGVAGAHFFGEGWGPPHGSPRARSLAPGRATLYLPLDPEARVRLAVGIAPSAATGKLGLPDMGGAARIDRETAEVEIPIAGERVRRGLNRVVLEWDGSGPLRVRELRVE